MPCLACDVTDLGLGLSCDVRETRYQTVPRETTGIQRPARPMRRRDSRRPRRPVWTDGVIGAAAAPTPRGNRQSGLTRVRLWRKLSQARSQRACRRHNTTGPNRRRATPDRQVFHIPRRCPFRYALQCSRSVFYRADGQGGQDDGFLDVFDDSLRFSDANEQERILGIRDIGLAEIWLTCPPCRMLPDPPT